MLHAACCGITLTPLQQDAAATKESKMNTKTHTAEEFASEYRLFAEYIDPDATTSEDEFNAMTFEQRVALCQQVIDANA
jgi:hypothetical protein